MEPIPADAERALRRSRNRLRVLFALASVRVAYLGQLSRMTGIPRERVRGCLLGDLPAYRIEHGLVALGLARRVETDNGTHYEITNRGLRYARSFARRLSRARKSDAAAQMAGRIAREDATT